MNCDPAQCDRGPSRSSPPARGLRLLFPPGCSSVAICQTLDRLVLPLSEGDASCARYALVELVANAVRASADKNVPEPVSLVIWRDGDRLRFRVSDCAGGFDLRALPYDFFSPCHDVDLESEAFDHYRKQRHGARFGLGLILARRSVEEFRLCFVDGRGREAPWRGDGSIRGTDITFSKRLAEGRDGPRF